MKPQHQEIAGSLLKKLIYFDIFDYPLMPIEVIKYCNYSGLTLEKGVEVLDELLHDNIINFECGYYYLGSDKNKIKRRIDGNLLANKKMKPAENYSALISKFPFVRAVFISGSLSKNFMKPDSDIDFFIIVEPGKLWLCRALLTLYKKVFLLNSRKNFCLNYFVDTNSLTIPDKNVFTATEIAFLKPMYNYSLYEKFLEANNWIRFEFPNMEFQANTINIKQGRFQKFLEFIFDNKLGEQLEKISFSIILSFWRRKFKDMSPKRFSLNLRSQHNVSKHHPNGFQERVLRSYSQKISQFSQHIDFQPPLNVETSILNSEYAN